MSDWEEVEDSLLKKRRKIVESGFITAKSMTYGYSSLERDENLFGRDLLTNIYYLFRVNEREPLQVTDTEGFFHIYPFKELKSEKPRMPLDVYDDRKAHDLSAFMLVPFDVQFDTFVTGWRKFVIPNLFLPKKDSSLPEKFRSSYQPVSLLYANHGVSIHSQDSIRELLEFPTRQEVVEDLFNWMGGVKEILSHEDTFNKKLEGKIIPVTGDLEGIKPVVSKIVYERYPLTQIPEKSLS